jgi:hypothetical protein
MSLDLMAGKIGLSLKRLNLGGERRVLGCLGLGILVERSWKT